LKQHWRRQSRQRHHHSTNHPSQPSRLRHYHRQTSCVVSASAVSRVSRHLREDVLRAVGRFEVVSHPEIFDGVKVRKGQTLASSATTRRYSLLRARHPQPDAAHERHRHPHQRVRKSRSHTKTKVLDTRKTIPACAHSINTPSAAAAASITASICRTASSSKTITSPLAAAFPRCSNVL